MILVVMMLSNTNRAAAAFLCAGATLESSLNLVPHANPVTLQDLAQPPGITNHTTLCISYSLSESYYAQHAMPHCAHYIMLRSGLHAVFVQDLNKSLIYRRNKSLIHRSNKSLIHHRNKSVIHRSKTSLIHHRNKSLLLPNHRRNKSLLLPNHRRKTSCHLPKSLLLPHCRLKWTITHKKGWVG